MSDMVGQKCTHLSKQFLLLAKHGGLTDNRLPSYQYCTP